MTFTKPPPAAALGGSPDEVETRFYEAYGRGDLDALMALWADDDDVVCIHPGGRRLVGLAAIRASFEAMFARGAAPVRLQHVRRMQQIGCALHHVVERIEPSSAGADIQGAAGLMSGRADAMPVVATNFYVKTAQGWRLAARHASVGDADDAGAAPAPESASSMLH